LKLVKIPFNFWLCTDLNSSHPFP